MNLKLAAALLAGTVLLASLCGCGRADTTGASAAELHLAVVLGNHANAPAANTALIKDVIFEACLSCASVTLICDDGEPYCTVVDIPAQGKGYSKAKYTQIANEQTGQLLAAAATMQAKTPEVDTLKAVQLAARSLAAVEGENAEKQLVILDSCLSTTGLLDFSQASLAYTDAAHVVEQLNAIQEIPDLSGVSVTVYCLGDVAGAQAGLTAAALDSLRGLWTAILEAGGAQVTIKSDLPLSSAYEEGTLPPVSPVAVEQNAVEVSGMDQTAEVLKGGAALSFDDTVIAFRPGTAELSNPEEAVRSLAYAIQFLNAAPEQKLLLAGTTAGWGDQESYCVPLSSQRANAVRTLLMEQGIDGDRLVAVGLGYQNTFYVDDHREDGSLDEAIAPKNRAVKLMDLSSATARSVLSDRS